RPSDFGFSPTALHRGAIDFELLDVPTNHARGAHDSHPPVFDSARTLGIRLATIWQKSVRPWMDLFCARTTPNRIIVGAIESSACCVGSDFEDSGLDRFAADFLSGDGVLDRARVDFDS